MDNLTDCGFTEERVKESNNRPDSLFLSVETYHATHTTVAVNPAMLGAKVPS